MNVSEAYSLGYEWGLLSGMMKAGHPEIHMHVRPLTLAEIFKNAVNFGYTYKFQPTEDSNVSLVFLTKET